MLTPYLINALLPLTGEVRPKSAWTRQITTKARAQTQARSQPVKKPQRGGARWAFTGQKTAQPWTDWPSIWGIPDQKSTPLGIHFVNTS